MTNQTLAENLALAMTHAEIEHLSPAKALRWYKDQGLADNLADALRRFKRNRKAYDSFLNLGFNIQMISDLFEEYGGR